MMFPSSDVDAFYFRGYLNSHLTFMKTWGYSLSTVSSNSSPSDSSSSSVLGSQAGGSPLVRKHKSYDKRSYYSILYGLNC